MEVFIVNALALRQTVLGRNILFFAAFNVFAKWLVVFTVVGGELIYREVEGLAELDGNFLLFQEDELVVLHVIFGVGFQVAAQFVQVQTVFVRAPLAVQEELAELGGAERGADHAVS